MLVTARDIVHRLPDADEACIRLELAGNLCRCTGYAGIVRAIQRVLAEGILVSVPAPMPLPTLQTMQVPRPIAPIHTPSGSDITQTLRLAAPIASVWSALRDPHLVASCVPGARLLELSADRLRGEIRTTLGPIDSLFTGEGTVAYDDTTHRADITGEGRDSRSNTRLSARAELHLREASSAATEVVVTVAYTLRGPLAQIARGAIVQEFAGAIAATFAANLQARLAGGTVSQQQHLSVASLIMRALWRRLRAILGAN
jgi:aerobic carbon-monoxide dehydrogenase small subunit